MSSVVERALLDKRAADYIANPEKIATLDTETDADFIKHLFQSIQGNKYGIVEDEAPGHVGEKTTVLLSIAQPREMYWKRMCAVSMIGFLFQLAKEYTAPADLLRWDRNEEEKKQQKDPFTVEELRSHAKEIKLLMDSVEDSHREFNKASAAISELEDEITATKDELSRRKAERELLGDSIEKHEEKMNKNFEDGIKKYVEENQEMVFKNILHNEIMAEAMSVKYANKLIEEVLNKKSSPTVAESSAEAAAADAPKDAIIEAAIEEAKKPKTLLERIHEFPFVKVMGAVDPIKIKLAEMPSPILMTRLVNASKRVDELTQNKEKQFVLEHLAKFNLTCRMYEQGKEANLRIDKSREVFEGYGKPDLNRRIREGATYHDRVPVGSIEIPNDIAKKYVSNFLESWFEYNPALHVKPSGEYQDADPAKRKKKFEELEAKVKTTSKRVKQVGLIDTADPERFTLDTIQARTPIPTGEAEKKVIDYVFGDISTYNSVLHVLREPHFSYMFGAHFGLDTAKVVDLSTGVEGAPIPVLTDSMKNDLLSSTFTASELYIKYPILRDDKDIKGFKFWLQCPEDNQGVLKYMLLNRDRTLHLIKPVYETLPLSREGVKHLAPADLFHRWKFYYEMNYESLATITETLYPEKRDIEFSICPHKVFTGPEHKIREDISNYRARNEMIFSHDFIECDTGKWTLLAPYAANRNAIRTAGSDSLQRILEQMDEDAKIGKELLKKKVVKAKAAEIKRLGPDDPNLRTYKEFNTKAQKVGADPVISSQDMHILALAAGDLTKVDELKVIQSNMRDLLDLEQRAGMIRTMIADVKKRHGEDAVIPSEFISQLSDYEFKIVDARKQIKELVSAVSTPDNAIQFTGFAYSAEEEKVIKHLFYTESEKPMTMEEKAKNFVEALGGVRTRADPSALPAAAAASRK